MNCSKCESSIDYRFPTTCPNCNSDLLTVNTGDASGQTFIQVKEQARPLKLVHHLANVVLTFAAASTGLIVGAVVTYLIGGCVYLLIYRNEVLDGDSCARGSAIAFLLVVLGANLGSVLGGVIGFQNRIYKSSG